MAKLKLALYWAAACGGCDVAVLDVHEKILNIAEAADIVLWPIAMDFKYKDVEVLADGEIDICLFNGAVRNSENEHLAHLLRRKTKAMVAFGSCAAFGGIPGLANFKDREDLLARVYRETPSTDNPDGVFPQTTYVVPEGELELPTFYGEVKALSQVVRVDYYLPGCPPTAEKVWEVVEAIVTANLPPAGATVGASEKTVCDECPRKKEEKKIKRFYRPYEVIPEPERCLLEQGVICLGPVTRGGCKGQCLSANMPCRGCYGPTEGVVDQGAKFISALGSIIDTEDAEEAKRIVEEIVDPAGTFYRFGLPTSLLRRAKKVAKSND